MKGISIIILAAGLGTRMKSNLVKILHPLAGMPMLAYTLDLAKSLKPEKIVAVIGHQAEKVKDTFSDYDVNWAIQKEQKGTGHAVMQAKNALNNFNDTVIVLSGDTPLLKKETISELIKSHKSKGSRVAILTTEIDNPYGYGRVIINANGKVERIVEEKDASETIKKIMLINTGIYAFDKEFLFNALSEIKPNNTQGEYYLTDIIGIAAKRGLEINAVKAKDSDEVMGINTRLELARAEKIIRKRINDRWMLNGVTIIDTETTFIDDTVEIGRDTIIYPNNFICGKTKIGEGCTIFPNSRIIDAEIGSEVKIKDSCLIEESKIGDRASVGPFAHLRPYTELGKGVKIGNFVEIKKSVLMDGAKANHLTYLGDSSIGRNVNIGAGTITCNYDGFKKHRTEIGDNVFVGSDVQFIAPVKIGKGAIVAAGTTVTEDVPADSLVISRTKQISKKGWARKKRERQSKS
ncbi:MAG: bifunctional UDP-N-acetylglucosamine diphosphorylase/glucosamine-1-phosphate N-acetyltransferase GlmU [Nitrospirae bacterium]|nr:bifunctional UDP-N-acetylglucosamine diphosphorylase/glucosamine-1-phosphate N-acetyltransferase GlmU [Nitrospirota bacterium]